MNFYGSGVSCHCGLLQPEANHRAAGNATMYNRNRSGAKKPVPTQTTDSSEQHANSGMQLWSCEARIRQSLIPPRANSSRQRIHFNARLKQEAKMSRSTRLFVLFAIVAAYTAIGGGLLQPQLTFAQPHRPRHWLTCAPRAPGTLTREVELQISVKVCATERGRAADAPLMVIFRGERLPGDRRTAQLSARAQHCGTVAARYRLPAGAGQRRGGGARDWRATGHRSRAGRRPGVAEQPRASRSSWR